MQRKKLLAFLLVCLLSVGALSGPASAHGGHHQGGCHGNRSQTPSCGVSGCTVAGTHSHSCAYHTDEACGGICVGLCAVEDCTLTGRHAHDGVTYCGNAHTAGFCDGTCVALCTVPGCRLGGQHVHDGVTYCGNYHENGFCENGCAACSYQKCHRH